VAHAIPGILRSAPYIGGRAIAQGECTSGDTPDDYSLQCAPNTVPDFNDQLSEAEVAEPGFNASPGGGGGGGMGAAVTVEAVDIVEQIPRRSVSHPMKA
jgi:hypothetical protein